MPYSTRPAAVSRYLAEGGFKRSEHRGMRSYRGYEVRAIGENTVVRFYIGSLNLGMNPDRRREITRDAIQQMERHLSKRYTVTMFEPDDGSNYRLTVRPLEG